MLTLEDGRQIKVEPNQTRGGLTTVFDLSSSTALQISPVWTTAGWQCRFLRLAPHKRLSLPDGGHLLKVITGTEVTSARSCFAQDRQIRSTRLAEPVSGESASSEGGYEIVAGANGLLAALFSETAAITSNIHDMSSVAFSGPQSSSLQWRSFKDRFGAATSYFDDLDNHMADGFHVRDSSGEDVCYVNFWTCGLGGDVSTHNHAHPPTSEYPPFAEVHLVLNNAGGESGMYLAPSPDSQDWQIFPMQSGEEHGPFFHHTGGVLERLSNGAIAYPWHGWASRGSVSAEKAYDFVVAFEVYPAFAEW